MLIYPAIFKNDEDNIFVSFPDIPEAITQGKDLQEAFAMATEVLGFALEDYSSYPEASDLFSLKKAYPNDIIALVNIDMLAYKRKYMSKKIRKNVTVPEWLNNLAEDNDINFSQVLTEALEMKLELKA